MRNVRSNYLMILLSCVSAGKATTFQPQKAALRCFTTLSLQSKMINTLQESFDWDDRIGLQNQFSLEEKGWLVDVDWRSTPYGAGLFACQRIPKGTVLRKGILGVNLIEFTSIQDIEDFCQKDPECATPRRNYVKDYLWGFPLYADEAGYPLDPEADGLDTAGERRFFGMWVPGNGLNHDTQPNTVYRSTSKGIDLVALRDHDANEEMTDDYRRHGKASDWLQEFASMYSVTLNFADCNDFVMNEDA